jgi:hypothetical protein
MIHYHGAPVPGDSNAQIKFFRQRDCLLSYANRKKCSPELLFSFCRTFVLDNGSYTFWKNDVETDWDGFYDWVKYWMHHPRFAWYLIPDVIGGTDEENDSLVENCKLENHGVPVFHIGESLGRISKFLDQGFKRMAIGSTPGYELKSSNFWNEMRKLFELICVEGSPKMKIHGLRMLDPEIVQAFPFSSCDSADAAMEGIFDYKWNHRYFPLTQAGRAAMVADYLERSQSPSVYIKRPTQIEMELC